MKEENENENVKGQSLDIELNEDVAEGIYSNLAIITHSQSEFIIDFIRILPNVPKAKVKSRIILTPQHAKRLMLALQDNIVKYEEQFDEIEVGAGPNQGFPINFGGMTGQA